MRKIIFMIMPLLAAILLVGCKGDEGPMGPMGPAGKDGLDGKNGSASGEPCMRFLKFDFNVSSKDWVLMQGDNGKQYFACEFNFSELDEDICEYGIVSAYLLWDEDNVTYQSQLPTVRHNSDGENYFTCTTDYDFAPGQITFYVTNSDFYAEEKPEDMVFRVAIYYPN